MYKIITMVFTTIMLVLSGAMLSAASSTTPGVEGASDCTSITWTVFGDRDSRYAQIGGTITNANVDNVTVSSLVNKRVKGDSQTQTYTLGNLGENVSKTLSVTVRFDNGHSASSQKSVKTKKDCKPPQPKDKTVNRDGKSCELGVWTQSGTQEYVWNGNTWVLEPDSGIEWGNVVHVRDLTPAEKKELNCVKPQHPEPWVENQSKDNCKGVWERTISHTFVFNESTWTWDEVVTVSDWTKVRSLSLGEREDLGCYLKVRTHVKVVNKCNCWADSVTMARNSHVRVVKSHPTNLKWVFKVTGKKGYSVPAKYGDNHGDYVKSAKYVFKTTNKPCPHTDPHNPAPPHNPCRATGRRDC